MSPQTHGQPAGKTGLADTARWRANRLSRTLPTPASGSRRIAGEKGCPQSGQVAIIADVDERTRKTGEAFAAGLAPDCAITVHTCADTSSPDPLFNPLKLAFANWITRT